MQLGGVGVLAGRRELLFAVAALAAGDDEAVDDSLPRRERGHGRADGFDNAAELVAEDVALFDLDDHAVHQVDVAAAHGCACHSNDGIVVINDFRFTRLNWMCVNRGVKNV